MTLVELAKDTFALEAVSSVGRIMYYEYKARVTNFTDNFQTTYYAVKLSGGNVIEIYDSIDKPFPEFSTKENFLPRKDLIEMWRKLASIS